MRKFEEARFVTFQEDYKIKTKPNGPNAGQPLTIYKKGQKVAMSVKLATTLQNRKAKLKVEEIDFKGIWAKQKAARQKQDEKRLAYA